MTNTDTTPKSSVDRWASLEVPLWQGVPEPGKKVGEDDRNIHGSRLRIACKKDGEDQEIDAGYTRMVIQVDIDADEMVEVDLSIVKRQISASITATSPMLSSLSEVEIPSFKEGLSKNGFNLQSSHCKIGDPKPATRLADLNGSNIALRVETLDIGA